MKDNTLAWTLTIGFVALILVAMVGLVLASPATLAGVNQRAPRSPQATQYARLFQERTRLQARVNFCEQQSRGDTPGYRRLCDESEQAKLDEYRARIAELDGELKELRQEVAPEQ